MASQLFSHVANKNNSFEDEFSDIIKKIQELKGLSNIEREAGIDEVIEALKKRKKSASIYFY
ncbi:hypothetical protein ACFL08_01690 [Patescibacteria group bacterium]